MKIVSWNVNGVRASAKNGMLQWLSFEQPDVVCLQEIKALEEDLEDIVKIPFGYLSYWHPAEKKGYSGVAIYSKTEPLDVKKGFGYKQFDSEGRVITARFSNFNLINAYFPNSQRDHARLGYKLDFCQAMLEYCEGLLRKGENIILCGDFNIAHTEIDLANPKTNTQNAGFLPEERAWMDKFLSSGYVDTFRNFEKKGGHYSWWSYRPGVREKNIGWRLDYHVTNQSFLKNIKKSYIQPEVRGSDHCPVVIELES